MNLPHPLRAVLSPSAAIRLDNWNHARQKLHDTPGLYVFWWHGDHLGPVALKANTEVQFVGPAVVEGDGVHECSFETEAAEQFIEPKYLPFNSLCLYVGKSTNIRQRIRQHLMPGTRSSLSYLTRDGVRAPNGNGESLYEANESTVFKRNFSSQFRAGMEYLFRHQTLENDNLTWSLIEQHIFVTQLPMADNQEVEGAPRDAFKRRFYGEDLLIGILQPWFNLDGER